MSTDAETTSAVATPVTPTKGSTPDSALGTPSKDSALGTPSKETDEAMNHLVQGKRHLLVRDYSSAVTSLGKACELLAAKFGESAPECGDAYHSYGKALLELARTESGVVELKEGDKDEASASDDDEEDNEADDDGTGEDKETNGETEGGKVNDANGEAAVPEAKGEQVVDDSADKEQSAETGEAEKKKNGEAHTTDGQENGVKAPEEVDKTEDEEDVNNLQLAWEMLELAKAAFNKQLEAKEDKQIALKLSEVHLKLGEVSLESENYPIAIEDMQSCLKIQEKHLADDDRRIAETLYNMGMAYYLSSDFDSAIEQFKAASEQIEKRIANLQKRKEKDAPEDKDGNEDAFYTVQGEIDELKGLLPEMKEKITDMKDFKKDTVRRMMESLAEESAKKSSKADGAGPSASNDKPVSCVSHLVKRKPKDEETVPVKSSEEIKTSVGIKFTAEKTTEKVEEGVGDKEEAMDAEELKNGKDCDQIDRKRKSDEEEKLTESQKKQKIVETAEIKSPE